ncbi:phage tail protein [Pyxidicoccus sp. 3LG]
MSTYVRYLPAILQQGAFIEPFLMAFERILTGPRASEAHPPGVEEALEQIHRYFDPRATPEPFLPWLAGWVSVSLRDDWSEASKRQFLGQVVPLYKRRGTRESLEELLRIFVKELFTQLGMDLPDDAVQVLDHDDDAQPRYFREDSPPHQFRVVLRMPGEDPVALARTVRIVRAVIEQEKPAHTFYALELRYQALRINDTPGQGSYGPGVIVGVNTVLGNKP